MSEQNPEATTHRPEELKFTFFASDELAADILFYAAAHYAGCGGTAKQIAALRKASKQFEANRSDLIDFDNQEHKTKLADSRQRKQERNDKAKADRAAKKSGATPCATPEEAQPVIHVNIPDMSTVPVVTLDVKTDQSVGTNDWEYPQPEGADKEPPVELTRVADPTAPEPSDEYSL